MRVYIVLLVVYIEYIFEISLSLALCVINSLQQFDAANSTTTEVISYCAYNGSFPCSHLSDSFYKDFILFAEQHKFIITNKGKPMAIVLVYNLLNLLILKPCKFFKFLNG